jgi:hypothetical protein
MYAAECVWDTDNPILSLPDLSANLTLFPPFQPLSALSYMRLSLENRKRFFHTFKTKKRQISANECLCRHEHRKRASGVEQEGQESMFLICFPFFC